MINSNKFMIYKNLKMEYKLYNHKKYNNNL